MADSMTLSMAIMFSEFGNVEYSGKDDFDKCWCLFIMEDKHWRHRVLRVSKKACHTSKHNEKRHRTQHEMTDRVARLVLLKWPPTLINLEVSWVMKVTPSHHPNFRLGFSMKEATQLWGYPHDELETSDMSSLVTSSELVKSPCAWNLPSQLWRKRSHVLHRFS